MYTHLSLLIELNTNHVELLVLIRLMDIFVDVFIVIEQVHVYLESLNFLSIICSSHLADLSVREIKK